MNDIFSDLLDVHVIIYLDDILIYSDNPADQRNMSVRSSAVFVLMVSMLVWISAVSPLILLSILASS